MAEKLLINVAHEETRVALVESGKISNLEIDTSRVDNNKGNIYKAVVHRVNDSLQAAFVDYGAEKQGFLPVAEIHKRYWPAGIKDKKPPIKDLLVQGQSLMVQIVKDEIGNKGASLTTYVSLPGRYLVLMADSDKTGISRRVEQDERTRLKRIMSGMDMPEGFGCIIRTAGIGREEEELRGDLEYLTRLWTNLQELYRGVRGAGVIHEERSAALRFIRDYAHAGIDEIVVDNKDAYEEIQNFTTVLVGELKNKVRLYDDPRPLFSRYQIEDQIDDIFARKIELKSGGSIVIDQTEALVAIDVNSGRVKTDDIEQTALTTNLEAAEEVARQLKIRDRGGLIVIDFIDMRSKDNIRKVEQTIRDAFASDKAKVKFSRISEFGLMEISRQRLQSSLMKGSFTPCSSCGGTGQIRSVESSAMYLLRRLKETVIRGNYMHVRARMPVAIANYMLNRKRPDLTELEQQTGTGIEVIAEAHCAPMVAYFEMMTKPGKSRSPRRILHTVDLVRSEAEKQDIDEDEDVLRDAALERTGWTPPSRSTEDLGAQNREIETEMAAEMAIVDAQRAADESLRRERELRLEAERLKQEAELLKIKEEQRRRSLNLWGRIKVFFSGMPPEEDEPEPDVAAPRPAKPSDQAKSSRSPDRSERSDRNDRSSRRDGRDGRDSRGKSSRSGGRSGRDESKRSERKPPSVESNKDAPKDSGDEKSKSDDRKASSDDPKRASGGGRSGGGRDSGRDSNRDGQSQDDGGTKKKRRRRRRKSAAERAESGDQSNSGDSANKDGRRSKQDDGDGGSGGRGGSRRGESKDSGDSKDGESKGRSSRSESKGDDKTGDSRRSSGREKKVVKKEAAAPKAPAALPKAGGVIDLRGGVVDLRGGRAPERRVEKTSAKAAAPAEKPAPAAKTSSEPDKGADAAKKTTKKKVTKKKAAPKKDAGETSDAKTATDAEKPAKKTTAKKTAKKSTTDAKTEKDATERAAPKKRRVTATKTKAATDAKAASGNGDAAASNGDAAKKPAAKKTTTRRATKKVATTDAGKKPAASKASDAASAPAPAKAAAPAATPSGGASSIRERLEALRASQTKD